RRGSTARSSTTPCPSSPTGGGSRPVKRSRSTCGSASPRVCRPRGRCTPCACRRGRISTRNTSVNRDPASPRLRASPGPMAPGVSPGTPGTPEARQPGSRRGRMLAESAAVEEVPVWLEVNGEPAVTWMCTPDQLEELATGWLHGEGYIETLDDLVKLRPCATDLGFWADVKPERVAAVKGEGRRRVLAS